MWVDVFGPVRLLLLGTGQVELEWRICSLVFADAGNAISQQIKNSICLEKVAPRDMRQPLMLNQQRLQHCRETVEEFSPEAKEQLGWLRGTSDRS